MTIIHKCCFGLLVLQISVNAAPNVDGKPTPPVENIKQTEEVPNVDYQETKLDSEPYEFSLENDKLNAESNNNQRQKRMFNSFAPPLININYPSFSRNPYEQSFYNYEDPYLQIYRKVLEIADTVRQPPPPPPPVFNQYPFFLPVIYIPQVGCTCYNQTDGTNPNIATRFPEYDDKRQVWGVLVNSTFPEEVGDGTRPISLYPLKPIRPPTTSPPVENEGDGSRPISLDPIPPSRPLSSSPPPVEHGSVQAGMSQQTTRRPQSVRPEMPSVCDVATITCCHQPEITYNCFLQQGCANPAVGSDNTLCTSNVILDAIKIFSKFYGMQN